MSLQDVNAFAPLANHLTRRGFLVLAGGAAIVAAQPAVALAQFTAPQTLTLKGIGEVKVQSRVLTIVSVDVPNRNVVVKQENGDQYAYHIAPIVGDLSQIKPDEKVTVYIAPGAVTALQKADSGVAGLLSDLQVDVDATGPLPENFWGSQKTINAVLVDVNKTAQTVTFEGHDKLLRTIPAANPQVADDLAGISPGDLCQITWIEAMAFIPAA